MKLWIWEFRAPWATLQDLLAAAQRELATVRDSLRLADVEILGLKRRYDQDQHEKERLRDLAADRGRELADASTDLLEQRAELLELRQTVGTMQSALHDRMAEVERLRAESQTWEESSQRWSAQCEKLLETIERMDERHGTLVADMLKMKREGFNPVPAGVVVGEVAEPELPSEVQDVITELAAGNQRLARQMRQDAARLLEDEETDVTEVIAHFRQGSASNVVLD